MTPGDSVAQLHPQALGIHFSRLLRHAWVTVGLFFNLGHHTRHLETIATVISVTAWEMSEDAGYANIKDVHLLMRLINKRASSPKLRTALLGITGLAHTPRTGTSFSLLAFLTGPCQLIWLCTAVGLFQISAAKETNSIRQDIR
jgi:hypothetical protein